MEKLPFRAIVDSINAGFYVVDRQNYRLCFVNQFLKHYKPGIQEGEICYKALRGRKKPCEFCPLTQGKAGKKPIRLEHFEGKDSPAAYISYDNMQSGGRCLFGVSIQFENGQEREPDSCVYYDPILSCKLMQCFLRILYSLPLEQHDIESFYSEIHRFSWLLR